jgi:hypothetical protein
MTHRLASVFAGLGALLLALPTDAHAGPVTLFTNFGAGFSYNIADGNPVGSGFDGNAYVEGETFRSGSTADLSTVELALSDTGGSTDTINVALHADAGDKPGATLESWSIPGGTVGPFGTNNPPIVLISLLQPLLIAGDQYWLTAGSPITSAYVWNFNSTGANADHANSTDNGATWFIGPSGFFTPGAFEVDGTASVNTPEPSSILLLLTGFAGSGLTKLLCKVAARS